MVVHTKENREKILEKLPYTCPIPALGGGNGKKYRNIQAWLIEHVGPEMFPEGSKVPDPDGVWSGLGTDIRFLREIDAFAFKMRWG